MKLLKPSMLITSIVALIMFILTCLSTIGTISFMERWVGVFLCVVFGVYFAIAAVCIFKTKFSLGKIGFFLLHAGILVFLLGGFMYFVSGEKLTVSGVETGNVSYNKITSSDGSTIDLGFGLQVKDFTVVKYPEKSDGTAADKFLNAQVVITPEDGSDAFERNLYVNGPLSYKGWKIYLMDYNRELYKINNQTTLTLVFKRNPGEFVSIIGIVFMIIGSFVMAFTPHSSKQKKGGKNNAK